MVNLLLNGGFDEGLNEWTATGAINRALGYPRLNCVELETGETVLQDRDLPEDNPITVHLFYRPAASGVVTVSYGSISQAFTLTMADQWHEGVMQFALDAPGSDDLTLTGSGGTVYVDTVTLMYGGLPISRSDTATAVAARLGAIATDASLSATVSASGPEGDYTAAIDEGLRSLSAVSRYGDPDITRLPAHKVNDLIEATLTAQLQTLRNTYALETDVSLGPRRESRSQIAKSIDDMLSGGGSDRRVKMAPLRHAEWRR